MGLIPILFRVYNRHKNTDSRRTVQESVEKKRKSQEMEASFGTQDGTSSRRMETIVLLVLMYSALSIINSAYCVMRY